MSNDQTTATPSVAPAPPRWRRAMRRGLTGPFSRWLDGHVKEVVNRELADTRAQLHADVATLVELTIELQRIASRLEAAGARAPTPEQ